MPMTPEGRARALEAVLGGPLYLALITATGEIDDAAYLRQPISFGDVDNDGDGASRANIDRIDFPPFAGDSDAEVAFWAVYDAALEGTALVSGEMAQAHVPLHGEAPFFPAGNIVVRLE